MHAHACGRAGHQSLHVCVCVLTCVCAYVLTCVCARSAAYCVLMGFCVAAWALGNVLYYITARLVLTRYKGTCLPVRACGRVCVHACVRACAHVCVCGIRLLCDDRHTHTQRVVSLQRAHVQTPL
jgi:hypothetical protein